MRQALDKLRKLPGRFQNMSLKARTFTGVSAVFMLPVVLVMAGVVLIGLGISLPFLLAGKKSGQTRIYRSVHTGFPHPKKEGPRRIEIHEN